MNQVILSYDENKHISGNKFLYEFSELAVAGAAYLDIWIKANKSASLTNLAVQSTAEAVSWIAYAGSSLSNGTVLPAIPTNALADKKSNLIVVSGPTIGAVGTPFFPNPLDLFGIVAAGGRSFIDQDLLSSPFILVPGLDYLLRIKNNDVGAETIAFSMTSYNDI